MQQKTENVSCMNRVEWAEMSTEEEGKYQEAEEEGKPQEGP
jgi:hypothetical protein